MNFQPYFCPLLCIAAAKGNRSGGHCLGEHCAWWDGKSQCAVTRLCDIDVTLSEELLTLLLVIIGVCNLFIQDKKK